MTSAVRPVDSFRCLSPGSARIQLPFEAPESPEEVHWHPAEPSPIARLLASDPSPVQRLVAGDIPPAASRWDQERTPS